MIKGSISVVIRAVRMIALHLVRSVHCLSFGLETGLPCCYFENAAEAMTKYEQQLEKMPERRSDRPLGQPLCNDESARLYRDEPKNAPEPKKP